MAVDRINLIPPEELRHGTGQGLGAQAAVFAAAAAVVLLLVVLSVIQQVQLKNKTETLAKVTVEHESLMRTIASQSNEAANLDRASQQLVAARQFLKDRSTWTDLFKELSLLVPRGVWLTQLSNSVKDGQFRIMLSGEAPSQQLVAELLGALESSFYFKYSTLQYSEKIVGYEPNLYRFGMESSVPQIKVREEKKVEVPK